MWANPPLLLYHGTDELSADSIIRNGVDFTKLRVRADFGCGFYMTTNLSQAHVWANQRGDWNQTKPCVMSFQIGQDDLATLDWPGFVRSSTGATDYWQFVAHCRENRKNHNRLANRGWYDVVMGPVAKNFVRRVAWEGYDQISFHTRKAVGALSDAKIISAGQ